MNRAEEEGEGEAEGVLTEAGDDDDDDAMRWWPLRGDRGGTSTGAEGASAMTEAGRCV